MEVLIIMAAIYFWPAHSLTTKGPTSQIYTVNLKKKKVPSGKYTL